MDRLLADVGVLILHRGGEDRQCSRIARSGEQLQCLLTHVVVWILGQHHQGLDGHRAAHTGQREQRVLADLSVRILQRFDERRVAAVAAGDRAAARRISLKFADSAQGAAFIRYGDRAGQRAAGHEVEQAPTHRRDGEAEGPAGPAPVRADPACHGIGLT